MPSEFGIVVIVLITLLTLNRVFGIIVTKEKLVDNSEDVFDLLDLIADEFPGLNVTCEYDVDSKYYKVTFDLGSLKQNEIDDLKVAVEDVSEHLLHSYSIKIEVVYK